MDNYLIENKNGDDEDVDDSLISDSI